MNGHKDELKGELKVVSHEKSEMKVMGHKRSEVKVEGQKKNWLKIGVGENNKYFFKINLDPWLFLLFVTTTTQI